MARAGALSGGNLQKALLARELAFDPEGADRRPADARPRHRRGAFHPRKVPRSARRRAAASSSSARIWKSCLTLSDRIAVMYEGRIVGDCSIADATIATIGMLMTG